MLPVTTMKFLTIDSPAKVNLFLKVVGRRSDGYHLLHTLFHRISIRDTITLRKMPSGIKIKTNSPSLPTDSRNLIFKAFQLLQKEVKIPGGVFVKLTKRIPIGGGLGGGSSNAAHFLLGMKKLYHLRISKAKLKRVGSKLGADVNFFLADTNQAIGKGVGDQIQPCPAKQKLWFVLIAMPKALSTTKVYQTYRKKNASRLKKPAKLPFGSFLTNKNRVATLSTSPKRLRAKGKDALLENDLQETSAQLYPAIQKALQLFEQLGVSAHLVSGSGPSVFGVVATQAQARLLSKKIQSKLRTYKKIFISHTL